jgi:hypothetical protein
MKPAPAGAVKGGSVVAGQLHDGSPGTDRGRAWTSSSARHLRSATLSSHSMNGSVTHQTKPKCQASSGTAHELQLPRAVPSPASSPRVRTFCTFSRRPAGPLAPPPRRARLRSRWRSRYGDANAGRLARKCRDAGPPLHVQQLPGLQPRGVHAPAAKLSEAAQNPSRAPTASAPPIFDS